MSSLKFSIPSKENDGHLIVEINDTTMSLEIKREGHVAQITIDDKSIKFLTARLFEVHTMGGMHVYFN